MIKVGLQIPNFTYPDTPRAELFERVATVAVTAEQAGVDTVMVMDHFYQLPLLGPPDHEMLEAYTLARGARALAPRASSSARSSPGSPTATRRSSPRSSPRST